MSDSEETKNAPSAPTEIVVRNADGVTFSTRLKDEKGRFLRKPKAMPEGREFTRKMRKTLNKLVEKGDMTEFEKAFINMLRIAQNEDTDPKAMSAAVLAFKELSMRALGKPSASDEEIEALKTSGVKVILVQPPQLMHQDIKEEQKEPQFIEAEILDKK
jgi:hypothetical protein